MAGSIVIDSLSCDQFEFEGVATTGLKIHKSRKHDDIPQVDGEGLTIQNTHCWWEKHRTDWLRSYKKYQNVLMDIKESPLSKKSP